MTAPTTPPPSSPHSNKRHVDLKATAVRAMVTNGFIPDFSAECQRELEGLGGRAEAALRTSHAKDLRAMLWSSIDNHESRDLDQIEVAERLPSGEIRVRVGVADVDALVPKGSALDQRAAANTTSVYTGISTFPMLPEVLSTGLTSLNQDVDRLAIVLDFAVKADGSLGATDVYLAVVRNQAKLAYDDLAAWLAGTGPVPPSVAPHAGLAEQLKLQDEAAQRLKALRHLRGALELETLEAHAVMKDGDVVGLELTEKSRSRQIIEDFMVSANGVMARFLESHQRSSIARIVKTPKRWSRIVELAAALGEKLPEEPNSAALNDFLNKRRAADPIHFADLSLSVVKLMGPGEYVLNTPAAPNEGHFGLAVHDYTHSTAPNRRFSDLVTQRLLKATLANVAAPYSDAELGQIAARCTLKENDERKVERFMRKVAAAQFLSTRIGEVFDGIITGVADKGTFVRLVNPPAEGRIVRGQEKLDVGDSVRVKLLSTEPEKGFLDFARA